jgi:predicted transcriptional regulator of viral defense system
MRKVDAYGHLRALGQPVIETREAATRLQTSLSTATKTLRAAEHAGLARQIRQGLWALDPDVSAVVAAPYLTAPYPAYLSFFSALARHEMIEQIPARIELASLARSQEVVTPIGVFAIHRLAPEVFTGFEGSPEGGYLAVPEKALFDSVYVRAPRGGVVRFPELTLPEDFQTALLDEWTELIPRARLRTIVARGIRSALDQADRYATGDYP